MTFKYDSVLLLATASHKALQPAKPSEPVGLSGAWPMGRLEEARGRARWMGFDSRGSTLLGERVTLEVEVLKRRVLMQSEGQSSGASVCY